MNVDIAYRLSKLRRDRNLSQEALANQLGVSRQAVSKWERAESSPDTDNLIALADLYGMSLDDLLRGDPEASDDETAADPGAVESPASDASTSDGAAEPSTSEGASGTAAFPNGVDVDDGGDHVHMSLRDGIHIRDHNGTEVHIGWNGIHVDDPTKGDHVNIDSTGIHVNDHDGNDVHTNDDGSVDVNGKRYDSWDAARDAIHEEHPKGWMSRFPYGLIVFLVFLCVGIFLGAWAEGFVLLLTACVWGSMAHLVDVFRGHGSSRRKRSAVMELVGTCSTFGFLAVGLLAGLWHPGWVLIFVSLAICGVIEASWHVDKEAEPAAMTGDKDD